MVCMPVYNAYVIILLNVLFIKYVFFIKKYFCNRVGSAPFH